MSKTRYRSWGKAIIRSIASGMILWSTSSSPNAKPCRPTNPDIKPLVIGFAGWTLPMTSYHGSAVEQIIDRLRARGLSAEIHPPNEWPDVAERLTTRGPSDSPIVLLGFSMGAAAAIHVAQKLGSVGIPVSNIVMVEAWNPEPVPGNVAEATHFYSTRIATPITPAPENRGTVENIDLNGRIPGIEDASHVSMSQMMSVQDLVIDKAGLDQPAHDLAASAGATTRCLDAGTHRRHERRATSKPSTSQVADTP